jgi:hypothetical protein
LWYAFGREGEILCLERCVGFEADRIASVAQIEQRTSSRADGAPFQAILLDIYRAEMFAVTAVLPLKLNWSIGLAVEIQLPQYVTFIFTLDGRLPWSEKTSFVLGTKYSHFRYSL